MSRRLLAALLATLVSTTALAEDELGPRQRGYASRNPQDPTAGAYFTEAEHTSFAQLKSREQIRAFVEMTAKQKFGINKLEYARFDGVIPKEHDALWLDEIARVKPRRPPAPYPDNDPCHGCTGMRPHAKSPSLKTRIKGWATRTVKRR